MAKDLREVFSTLDALRSQRDGLSTKCDRLERDVTTRDAEIARLHSENASFRAHNQRLADDIRTRDAQLAKTTALLSVAQSSLKELSVQYDRLRTASSERREAPSAQLLEPERGAAGTRRASSVSLVSITPSENRLPQWPHAATQLQTSLHDIRRSDAMLQQTRLVAADMRSTALALEAESGALRMQLRRQAAAAVAASLSACLSGRARVDLRRAFDGLLMHARHAWTIEAVRRQNALQMEALQERSDWAQRGVAASRAVNSWLRYAVYANSRRDAQRRAAASIIRLRRVSVLRAVRAAVARRSALRRLAELSNKAVRRLSMCAWRAGASASVKGAHAHGTRRLELQLGRACDLLGRRHGVRNALSTWRCFSSAQKALAMNQRLRQAYTRLSAAVEQSVASGTKRRVIHAWFVALRDQRLRRHIINRMLRRTATSQLRSAWGLWRQHVSTSSRESACHDLATAAIAKRTTQRRLRSHWDAWFMHWRRERRLAAATVKTHTVTESCNTKRALRVWSTFTDTRKAARQRKNVTDTALLLLLRRRVGRSEPCALTETAASSMTAPPTPGARARSVTMESRVIRAWGGWREELRKRQADQARRLIAAKAVSAAATLASNAQRRAVLRLWSLAVRATQLAEARSSATALLTRREGAVRDEIRAMLTALGRWRHLASCSVARSRVVHLGRFIERRTAERARGKALRVWSCQVRVNSELRSKGAAIRSAEGAAEDTHKRNQALVLSNAIARWGLLSCRVGSRSLQRGRAAAALRAVIDAAALRRARAGASVTALRWALSRWAQALLAGQATTAIVESHDRAVGALHSLHSTLHLCLRACSIGSSARSLCSAVSSLGLHPEFSRSFGAQCSVVLWVVDGAKRTLRSTGTTPLSASSAFDGSSAGKSSRARGKGSTGMVEVSVGLGLAGLAAAHFLGLADPFHPPRAGRSLLLNADGATIGVAVVDPMKDEAYDSSLDASIRALYEGNTDPSATVTALLLPCMAESASSRGVEPTGLVGVLVLGLASARPLEPAQLYVTNVLTAACAAGISRITAHAHARHVEAAAADAVQRAHRQLQATGLQIEETKQDGARLVNSLQEALSLKEQAEVVAASHLADLSALQEELDGMRAKQTELPRLLRSAEDAAERALELERALGSTKQQLATARAELSAARAERDSARDESIRRQAGASQLEAALHVAMDTVRLRELEAEALNDTAQGVLRVEAEGLGHPSYVDGQLVERFPPAPSRGRLELGLRPSDRVREPALTSELQAAQDEAKAAATRADAANEQVVNLQARVDAALRNCSATLEQKDASLRACEARRAELTVIVEQNDASLRACEALLAVSAEAAASSKAALELQASEWKKRTDEAAAEHEASVGQLTVQIDRLRANDKASSDQVAALLAERDGATLQLAAVRSQHAIELEEQSTNHRLQCSQLEDALRDAQAAKARTLEDLQITQSHNDACRAEIECLRREIERGVAKLEQATIAHDEEVKHLADLHRTELHAAALEAAQEHEQALETVKAELSAAAARDLDAQLRRLANEHESAIVTLRRCLDDERAHSVSIDSQMQRLQAQHSEDLQRAAAAHQATLEAAVKEAKAAGELALQALRLSLVQTVEASQKTDVRRVLDDAQQRVVSAEEKARRIAEEAERAAADFKSQLNDVMVSGAQALAGQQQELEHDFEARLRLFAAQQAAVHDVKLRQIAQRHAEALADLRAELEAQHRAQCSQLTRECEEHKEDALAQQRAEFDAHVEGLRAAEAARVDRLMFDHSEKLDAVRKDLADHLALQVERNVEEIARQRANDTLGDALVGRSAALQAQAAARRLSTKDSRVSVNGSPRFEGASEAEGLRIALDAAHASLQQLKSASESTLRDLQAAHEFTLTSLRIQLEEEMAGVVAEAMSAHESDKNRLRESCAKEHAAAMAAATSQHGVQIALLERRVQTAEEKAAAADAACAAFVVQLDVAARAAAEKEQLLYERAGASDRAFTDTTEQLHAAGIRFTECDDELRRLRTECALLQAAVQDERRVRDAVVADLENRLQSEYSLQDARDAAANALRQEQAALLSAASRASSALEDDVTRVTAELQRVQDEYRVLKDENTMIQREVDAARLACLSREATIDDQRSMIAALQTSLEVAKQEQRKAHVAVEAAHTELRVLRDAHDAELTRIRGGHAGKQAADLAAALQLAKTHEARYVSKVAELREMAERQLALQEQKHGAELERLARDHEDEMFALRAEHDGLLLARQADYDARGQGLLDRATALQARVRMREVPAAKLASTS